MLHSRAVSKRIKSPAVPLTMAGCSPWSVKLSRSSSGKPLPTHLRSSPSPCHREAREAPMAATISGVCDPAAKRRCRLAGELRAVHGAEALTDDSGRARLPVHVEDWEDGVADELVVAVAVLQRGRASQLGRRRSNEKSRRTWL